MHLGAERIFIRMRDDELLERGDKGVPALRGPGEASRVGEDDAVVPLPRRRGVAMADGEVAHVLGDQRASLVGGRREELGIGEPAELGALGDRDDVVSACSELDGNGQVVVLVEQQPQRSASCSRRQAASCSSAASSFALISASISSRQAA